MERSAGKPPGSWAPDHNLFTSKPEYGGQIIDLLERWSLDD
jgi:hypothetical protein